MTTEQTKTQRGYQGPAFLSGGFRPMFLFAAIWAALAMLLWVLVFAAGLNIPSLFDPVDWHVHELLFGFGSAVLCGFLFTAIPNWTGRLPVAGKALAAMTALWLTGRVAVLFGAFLPAALVAAVDLGFLLALVAIISREILAGKNWRNLPVLLIVTLFLAANALFYFDALRGEAASQGVGFRLGLGALILLLGLIGGRIIPSFTRNWLAKQGADRMPTPFNRFDKNVLLASAVTLAIWAVAPNSAVTGLLLLTAGILHAARLSRWAGWQSRGEILVLVLHLGYAFLPLGFALIGGAILTPDLIPQATGLHAWLVGGVAAIMLAVMTRASLGHTGRPLASGTREIVIYWAILLAALTRIAATFSAAPPWMLHLSATLWIVAFAGFSLLYGPMLVQPKKAVKRPNPRP